MKRFLVLVLIAGQLLLLSIAIIAALALLDHQAFALQCLLGALLLSALIELVKTWLAVRR